MQIGRGQTATVTINQPSISRVHAEFLCDDGFVRLRDCESRNGTYLNHRKIQSAEWLHPGDVIHLGSCEFRVVLENETLDEQRNADETWIIKEPGSREFQDMLRTQAVHTQFQPMVMLDDQTIFGFETLGRGNYPGAPTRPEELFRMAKRYGRSTMLSSIFRMQSIKTAHKMPEAYQIFINVHPEELSQPKQLISEMAQIHDIYPRLNLVMEIPENLMIETSTVVEVRSRLREFGYGIAYDDFGKGQSRLIQLTDCPPDYLKFDRSLITNIESAPAHRQKMVEMLVKFAEDIGVATIAEGIETIAEFSTCQQMGFRCGQGFLFGEPMPSQQAVAM